ncbi:thermonuclease family protein [Neorhizobium galegae]|uniref:thermonuclease family protein n=1 Tax=Neorhizobium galegae TaxID=399 RepID=UPI00062221B4|nr:thermonuclease family protein [Neorhizobium galegae]CDZ31031.1 Micrococcal nuclease-like nuclease [Neorhizobium galegae bv. officinalis]KAA9385271.1 thermonuclease family protein [Neorhizobium galegae]KAB1112002.1 thermonuclease family protein [Neorhizobium galegae]MCM2501828.1 thermonuclease family protein [Neorhizobium galegae]MCQ1771963.1 thermonuclease family protein [Neorhizobium galegae]
MIKSLLIVTGIVAVFAAEVEARDEISGPVAAEILRVIDGDTLLVEAQPWPQQKMEVYVRIRGIDAPELKSKCERLREAGLDARRALEALTAQSRKIQLTHISGDKYFGRIVADVVLSDGRNARDDLLLAGLVQSYDGGRKPRQVCDTN